MPSVFITGASGCVGHYLVDVLSPDYELFLLVRNPAKLRFDPAKFKNITIINGDLDSISTQADLLSKMDYCIHAATAWGGAAAERLNVERVHELFGLLNPSKIRRVIYFSTASILGKGNRLIPEAEQYGTNYIKSKYRCYTNLPKVPIYDRIVTVFPTLIFGGDADHPISYLSTGLPYLKRFARLLGHINLNINFHFIHARDIAEVVRFILEAPDVEKNYVLGNPAVSFGSLTKSIAGYYGHKVRWQLPLSLKLILGIGKITGAKISKYDQICLEKYGFQYRTVNCATFNIASQFSTIEEILTDWEFSSAKK